MIRMYIYTRYGTYIMLDYIVKVVRVCITAGVPNVCNIQYELWTHIYIDKREHNLLEKESPASSPVVVFCSHCLLGAH